MSSEGTLSIGSEEDVQELSSSKSNSEVETSNSGGTERSGQGEESEREAEVGVLSNILDVDNSRAKCYNEEDEVVSEVVGYEAFWKSKSDLTHLVEQYAIRGMCYLDRLVRWKGCAQRQGTIGCPYMAIIYQLSLGSQHLSC
ncbi:hypothetical protein SLEP1_g9435 [Rubroshorea leprosula]|uniref:Uncharacterized protein n=1 Tax=Rubroshorea leprosula TaxID=152421 RepID=A0AAV5I4W2_9ROSI|nr:hypothetical protein SLEP1_g9435 [Rubroshorea leprosula]